MTPIELLRGPQLWNSPALTERPAMGKRSRRKARQASQGRVGCSRATFLAQVKDGLMPKPVKISERVNGWPSREISEVLAARVAGASTDAIKNLVAKLTAQRATLHTS